MFKDDSLEESGRVVSTAAYALLKDKDSKLSRARPSALHMSRLVVGRGSSAPRL